ncbi:organic cation/carnitine transporter 2-like [Osmerus eperlanus]|uniref:organic cation/carnitine transporter 2-like n=1 Tax=Osmerus eperlanus TaxID=29151 RepID=UPI002E10C942
MLDYEERTAFLGEWGTFQKMVFFLLSLSSIPNGYVGMAMVFLADIPSYRCRVPGLNSSSFNLDLNLSFPLEEVRGEVVLSRCLRYRDPPGPNGDETEGCLDGWEFSTERYTSTIVTEWDLVCDDDWKAPFTVTIFFVGVLCGSFLSGIVSDRFGRRLVLFGTLAMQTVFTLLQAASTSWEMFCFFYFIVGVSETTNYSAAFILGSELLTKSVRVNFGALGVSFSYALGYTVLPLAAYCFRSWRLLLVVLAIPGFLYIPLWWYIPESPRWLLTQGRLKEAESIIKAAAKMNGLTAPDVIFTEDVTAELMENRAKESPRLYTWLDLVRTRNIRNLTIINILIWIIISMTYYGMSLNTPNMDGDPYFNCLVAAATEFLAYGSVWFLIRYTPRRFTLPFTLLLSGGLLLFIKLIPDELSGLTLTLVMVGKTGVTGAFCFLYLYMMELFPTVVRNMALGVISMASHVGSTVSPYIAFMGTYNKFLPFILMGGATVMIGLLSLWLPETKGEELPEFIHQVKPLQRVCLRQQGKESTHDRKKGTTSVEI